jgi:hypothetical protein
MEFLAPTYSGGFTSGSSTTSHLFVFSWNWLLLYPKVAHTDDLMFEPGIRLPAGWQFASGLGPSSRTRDFVLFKPTSLTMLVDSPVLARKPRRVVERQRPRLGRDDLGRAEELARRVDRVHPELDRAPTLHACRRGLREHEEQREDRQQQ